MSSLYSDGDVLSGNIKAFLNRPFIQLQEYVPGYTLHLLTHRSQVAFDPLSPDSPDRLLTLGKIIAADLIVNNPDRVPSYKWKEGNSGNIMIEVDVGTIDEE